MLLRGREGGRGRDVNKRKLGRGKKRRRRRRKRRKRRKREE